MGTQMEQPVAQNHPGQASSERPRRSRLKRSPFFRTRRRTIITLILAIPLLSCLGYWLIGMIAFGSTAKLVDLKGIVQYQAAKTPRWEPVALNQLLHRQERVRTGDNSSAQLLFSDVSTVELGENTEISIEQVSKRRGGSAMDIVLKTWVGKTIVRAVRFVDPSSTLRIDTPTASTVVRGARFSIQVAQDGTIQIDVYEGEAEVVIARPSEAGQQVTSLKMGEQMTIKPDGSYETTIMFEPDAKPVVDKVTQEWARSDEEFKLELTEAEVNQFLMAMSEQPDFFLTKPQIWFLDGEARISATLTKPTHADLNAALSFTIADGKVVPDIKSLSVGQALRVPKALLAPMVNLALSQLDAYLAQAYAFVQFDQVEIKDGLLVVSGHKQPNTPTQ